MLSRTVARVLSTLFLVSLFATTGGCNTVEGAGKDIQQGGKAIKDEAAEQKKY